MPDEKVQFDYDAAEDEIDSSIRDLETALGSLKELLKSRPFDWDAVEREAQELDSYAGDVMFKIDDQFEQYHDMEGDSNG